jgi:protein-disulfide isomerase
MSKNKARHSSVKKESNPWMIVSIVLGAIVLLGLGFLLGNVGTQNTQTGSGRGTQTAPSFNTNDLLKGAAGVLGKNSAPVVLIEYSDFQCPFCRAWFESSKEQLIKEYVESGKVQFMYKDLPLSFHLMAMPYAIAARCAGEQGKFWEMHDKIFSEQAKLGQGTITSLTADDIKKWASELGLNTDSFNSCLGSNKFSSQISANSSEATSLGINGTPSFFIGKRGGSGTIVEGAVPYSTLKQSIESMLS